MGFVSLGFIGLVCKLVVFVGGMLLVVFVLVMLEIRD